MVLKAQLLTKEIIISQIKRTAFPGGIIEERFEKKSVKNLLPGEKSEITITTSLSVENEGGKRRNITKLFPPWLSAVNIHLNSSLWNKEEKLTEDMPVFEILECNAGNPEYRGRKSLIFYNRLTKPGDRLSLLHEIGHGLYNNIENLLDINAAIEDAAYDAHDKKRELPSGREIVIPVENSNNELVPTPIPKKLYWEYLKTHAYNERVAWWYALKKIRHWRKIGLDIEPELKKKKDFDKIIYGEGLETYELKAIENMIEGPEPPRFFIKNRPLIYNKAA